MDCKLSITAGARDGKSYMKDVFVSAPFRVVPVGQTKSDGAAYLMVMSSSPGILDGDHYDLNIQVEQNARLQVQSQSYQRLFNMERGASQLMQVNLADGAAFSYVPHPVVPHENSTFKSVTKVALGDACEFLMSEIITCGRKYHGEVFKYSHFQNLIEVRHRQKLILKDNVLLLPELMPLAAIGLLEGFTHQGTLIYVNTGNQPVDELIECIYEMMQGEQEVQFGISKIRHDGFVLRCLGHGGEQLYDRFQSIQNLIWEESKVSIA